MENLKVTESIFGIMVVSLKVYFIMVYVMEKENGEGSMIEKYVIHMKVNTLMIRNADKGYLDGRVEISIVEVSLMIYVMVMVKCYKMMEHFIKVFGIMVNKIWRRNLYNYKNIQIL